MAAPSPATARPAQGNLSDRRFLGWDRPVLHSLADELISGCTGPSGPLDLSSLLVVLPGARAGRRLKELLVDRAAESKRPLRPPEITTVGRLPERLYRPERPEPDPVLDRLAWRQALLGLDRESLLQIASRPEGDSGGKTELAASLSGAVGTLHVTVAAAGVGFREVVALCRGGLPFSDHKRWLMLAGVQERYRAILDQHGLSDLATSRQVALSRGEAASALRIWIACAPDLPPIVRAFLEALPPEDPLRILIGAPAELGHAFDALGCVIPDEWEKIHAETPDSAIHIAFGPAGQADAVIRSLSESESGSVPAEEITVGVPDREVVPYLIERFAEHGVQARYAAGIPLAKTGVFRLLEELVGYLEYPDFVAVGGLVRHPVLERALLARMKNPPADLNGLFDRYQSLHLQARVDRGRLPHGGERVSDSLQPKVQNARNALSDLLSEFTGERTLSSWQPALTDLLLELSGRYLELPDPSPADEGALLVFAEAAGAVLERLLSLPPELDPPTSADQVLRFLLDQLRQTVVPADAAHEAVELLGWLELPFDDASAMIVCGFNEPHVPRSVTSDPFLPHSLRKAMGLLDNRGRWARDLLYLRTIQETRGRLTLVSGRWDGEGNPVLPSRLLFAETDSVVVQRVRRCFGDQEQGIVGHVVAEDFDLGSPDSFRLPPEPVISTDLPPARIPVTAFRLLLEDPYRYALERVLRLERIDDAARELDGLGFGALTHKVLEYFGKDASAGSTDPKTIRRVLFELLEAEARERFGGRPLPAVRLQMGQLRARLAAFAEWQSEWVGKGWVIKAIEASPGDGGAEFTVDGTPILLTGKLDRVDYNERTDGWCILDYKTGERIESPESSHRRASKGGKRWKDLQLPLYRVLAAALTDEERRPLILADALRAISVGYVVIPRDLRVRELLAEWSPEDLAEAEETAREAVRTLRSNRFEYDPRTSTIQPRMHLAPVVGGGVLRVFGTGSEGAWGE